MEIKKNKKYDLENKRPLFFGIGMIISLSLTLLAFEWKSEIEPLVTPREPEPEDWYVIMDPIVTEQPRLEPPKPIVPAKRVLNQSTVIKEVTEDLFETTDIILVDQETEVVEVSPAITVEEEAPEELFLFVEEMPAFPGGDQALLRYIGKNLKYPRKAQNIGVEGKVFLTFIIDEKGKVSDVAVVKGIGAGCDEEAIRVVSSLPQFSPGKQRGIPVKVKMMLPISFKLN